MSRAGGVTLLGTARRAVLLGLVAGLPLLFLWDVTNQPFAVPKLALLTAAVTVAGALRAAELALGASGGALRALVFPAAFVAVPAGIAWGASDYRSWALWGAYGRYEGLLPTLLVVAAGVLLADAFAGRLGPVAWALTGSAAGVGLYATLQSVGLDPLGIPVDEYAPSTIGHSNFVGGFLAIALPVSLALWAAAGGRTRVVAIGAAMAIGLGLLMAFSQGGWLAAAGGLAVYVGSRLGPGRSRLRIAGWVGAGAVAAAAIGLVLFSLVRPFHPAVPDTVRARGLWWRGAAAMGAASPVWGHGPNVYAVEGAHYRNAEDAFAHDRSVADAPHSVPLSLFANHGLLGLGGFAALIVWTVRRGLASSSPLEQAFAAGAAAYLVQSFVSIDMTVLTLGLWVCLAGLGAGHPEDRRDSRVPGPARRALAGLLILVPSAAALWWSAGLVAADARVLAATEAFDDGRTAEALAALEDVVGDRPTEHYRHLYGAMLGRAAMRAGAAGGDEIDRMEEVFGYLGDFPDVQGLASYAESLHLWSVYDPAVEADALPRLRRLLELDEHSPSARVWTAEALVRLGRAGDAIAVLEPMVPLISDEHPEYGVLHPEVWGALAISYFEAGRADEAATALVRARETSGERAARDCHVLVAGELLRNEGEAVPRDELVESSPGLLLCKPSTLALLPGYDPQLDD